MYYGDMLKLMETFKSHSVAGTIGLVMCIGLIIFLIYFERRRR